MNAKIGKTKTAIFSRTSSVKNPLPAARFGVAMASNAGTSGLNGAGVALGAPTIAVVRQNNV